METTFKKKFETEVKPAKKKANVNRVRVVWSWVEEIPLPWPKLPMKLISTVKFDLAVGIGGVLSL